MCDGKDEYSEIYNEDKIVFESVDTFYDYAYDEEGDSVYCDYCGSEIIFQDGEYTCLGCGQVMDRKTFFNYIGAEPPGKECLTCTNLYPGCMICPYGYVEEEF